MSIPLGAILSFLSGTAIGVSASVLISLLRKMLDRAWPRAKLSVEGKSIELDANRPGELKHFVLSLMDEPQVFVAYAFKDTGYAKRLAEDLRRSGLRVWLSEEQIRAGDNIQNRIEDALQTSGYLLALLSQASLASKWVTNELQMALLRESHGKWPRVIPVLIEPLDIPTDIQGKLNIDLTRDYDAGVQKIVSAITDASASASKKDLPTGASRATN